MSDLKSKPTVAVVVTTFNDRHFLEDALDSIAAQTVSPSEVLVVDDGSENDPSEIVLRYQGTRLIRQSNTGLAGARNTGLKAASSTYIVFLDADDKLAHSALADGLACFEQHPDAALVYGAFRRVDERGNAISPILFDPAGEKAHEALLQGNIIGMHGTVMYRRDLLLDTGGFDASLRRCEDYDVYLRLSRHHEIASHSALVADYRIHGENMSGDVSAMLRSVLAVHKAHRPAQALGPAALHAWRNGRRVWRDYYVGSALAQARDARVPWRSRVALSFKLSPAWTARRIVRGTARAAFGAAARLPVGRIFRRLKVRTRPAIGQVDFGDFAHPYPVSEDFGWDRGTPADRYYIESFLARHASDIAGRVLEIGDDAYSRRFGGDRILQQDILHVDARNPRATIFGDISMQDVLPRSAFDAIILTQTLHLIYDMAAALANLYEALQPGGVLLVTVPGISQIDRGEWGAAWYWSLTPAAVSRLLDQSCPGASVQVEQHGNVYAATAFLQGVAVEELDRRNMDHRDSAYPVIVTARVVKS